MTVWGDRAERHLLDEILRVTDIPADRRSDLDYLRSAVVLARAYAKALLLPELEPWQPNLFDDDEP